MIKQLLKLLMVDTFTNRYQAQHFSVSLELSPVVVFLGVAALVTYNHVATLSLDVNHAQCFDPLPYFVEHTESSNDKIRTEK